VSNEHQVDLNSIEITNLRATSGSKKHEGFVCEVLAVDFDATVGSETFEKHYMVKYMKPGSKSDMFKKVVHFQSNPFQVNNN